MCERETSLSLLRLQIVSFIKISFQVCMNLSVQVRTTQVYRYHSFINVEGQ